MDAEIYSGKNKLAATIHDAVTISPIGLAILLSGFCDSRRYPHMKLLGEDLAENGYTAVAFDATGMWESDGKIKKYSLTQSLDDIQEVRHFMEKRHGSNIGKVVICGHSLGGMISLIYTSKDKSVSATAAIMSPSKFFHKDEEKVVEWKRTGTKVSFRDHPDDKRRVAFHLPYLMWQDADKYDAREAVQKIRTPLIFIAGALDSGVTPQSVKELYDKASKPKRLRILEGIDHNYRENVSHVAIVNKEILNFLSDHNLL